MLYFVTGNSTPIGGTGWEGLPGGGFSSLGADMSGAEATSITSALGPESVGEALRLLRRRARLSRDELAGRAGLSAGAVSNYENDISAVPAANLRTLIRVLAGELAIEAAIVWQEFGELLDAS